MADRTPIIRTADVDDLPRVNALVARALTTWDLPERVKRLALPTYLYEPEDLASLTLVAAYLAGTMVGTAAWEAGRFEAVSTLSLHGLYVDPRYWGIGVGSRLLEAAEQAAWAQSAAAITVKAQAGARGFFLARGFAPPEARQGSDYAHLLWKTLAKSP